MKTQLQTLRKLVVHGTNIPVNRHNNSKHTEQSNINWIDELPKIKEELLEDIHGLVLSKKDDSLVKRHLQETQRECIELLNLLADCGTSNGIKEDLHFAVTSCLEAVLMHIFNYHQYNFNWNFYAPVLQLATYQKELEQKMNLLKAGLKSKNVDRELRDLITDAFNRFNQARYLTYQQLNYMKALQQSLIKLCNKVSNLKFDELLIEHLFYHGFNESAFVSYCKYHITITITQLYQVELQYEKLCFYEKILMAQQEKPNCSFSTDRLSIKSQILAFVTAELNYLQKKQHYHGLKQGRNQALSPPFRVKVSLAADTLAYVVRLLAETEVIQHSPRSTLLQFLAKHVQTTGIGDQFLSAQSLGTKYKQVTQSTATKVKALLNRMIKQLEKDFG